MSGIKMIQQRASRSTSSERSGAGSLRRELWLRDGDQAFLASVATGDDDDPFLEEYWMHTFRDENTFKSVLSGPDGPLGQVPSDSKPQHRFGFWAYIIEVYHSEQRMDSWESITGPSGKTMYKEIVNDFRIIPLSFGRGNYIWNQLVDVYNDWGFLNKGVIRIRRAGAALDTTYTITATTKEDEIPDDKYTDISDLPSVKDYLMDTYTETGASSVKEDEEIPETSVSLEDDTDDNLPF
jgi:hypothetical protein